LVAAAARVFARHGYHGASLDQIAAEGGYSTGAIYWHFSGKEDLFLAVYEDYARTRAQEWEEIRSAARDDTGPRARAFADQWMDRLRRDPESMVMTVEFVVHVWRNPRLHKRFGELAALGRKDLAHILDQASKTQRLDLRMPPEDLATVLRELGSGLALAKLADPDAFPDGLFGDFIELFFSLLAQRGGTGQRKSLRRAGKP